MALLELAPSGGLLHYIVQLGDALADLGYEVDIIAPRGNELAQHIGRARMRALLTPHIRSLRTQRMGWLPYACRRAGIAARLVRGWSGVIWQALVGKYDVFITGSDLGNPVGAMGMLALMHLPRRPRVVFICHNVRPFNRWGGQDLLVSDRRTMFLLGRIFSRLDLVVVHGERSRKEFEETWPPAPLAVIPHGDERIFAGEPPAPATEERILFFGDWRKVKGLTVLMEAFDQLAARRPDVRLTLAGTPAPGDFDPELILRWAERHGERVTVIGRYVPIEEVRPLFATARVVVTPYLVGYQSGVVHLAMTMARAVVATDVGDLPSSVIDGETGVVVPPGDAQALAKALEEVVTSPALADRLGRESRRRVTQSSSWEAVARQWELALLPLLGERAACSGSSHRP